MEIQVNMPRVIEFLAVLLNTPSPTGYHIEANRCVEDAFAGLAIPGLEIAHTNKGALILTLPGEGQRAPRALAAHVDTLGAMVREIKSNGRLLLSPIGGYAWNAVEGENVSVHSVASERRIRGTIQTVTPSIHTSQEMRDGSRKAERMEVRLDARTATADETRALGIEVGDFVFFDPRVEVTDTGYIKSRHLDDKAGVAALYGATLALADAHLVPSARTTLFFSNYEEVGHGGAAGIPRDVEELIVVDMAASTTGEHQNSNEYSVGICAKDSSGPHDLELRRRLTALCIQDGIPYAIDTYPSYRSDGSAFLVAGGDVRVGIFGPGLDASHGYERTHNDSLEATVRLIAQYMLEQDQAR